MSKAPRFFWISLVLLSLFSLTVTQFNAATPAQTLNIPDGGVIEDEADPEITSRVARISFLRGDAKIRHAGSDEWETVTLNLPIVEGDEIVTDKDARLEIQFDNYRHLRLDENAYLKVSNLKYEGIAVSISLGTMTLRVTAFDKDKSYLEIDAPKTTLAIQRSGTYRVDSGKDGDLDIRATVTNGGEARVYSDNSGFTLKNNRSARIFIDGPTIGEWETAEASRFETEFDAWALERDDTIAKRLKDAHYDKYYDQDIYGAEDLTYAGDWVYRPSYGYVWRPHSSSLSRWADWSPYRYGHWRWIPPYGWTWINDEPWGWATYHHGRWFYDAGYWYWSPYGYYRTRRSWWFPALVVINVFNNNVCWYPLGWRHRYHNYNGRRHRGNYGNNNNNQAANTNNNPPVTGGVKPIPSDTTRGGTTGGLKGIPVDETRAGSVKKGEVPPAGVVTVRADEFGTRRSGVKTAPPAIAATALAAGVSDDNAPALPIYSPVKVSPEIVTTRPKIDVAPLATRVGAAPRKSAAPLDDELRTTRVFGGRPPLVIANPDTGGAKSLPAPASEPSREPSREPRKTGAVERPPVVVKQSDDQPPVRVAPSYSPPSRAPETRSTEPVKTTRSDPPQETRTTRSEQPVKQAPPRNDPPPRSEPPPTRSEPTRSSPPPTKSDPPPSKTESRPTDSSSKKKDGR